MITQNIFIGLGSNLGLPEFNLEKACRVLSSCPGMHLLRKSSIYQTEPQGLKDQPWFANQVLWLLADSFWKPQSLMIMLKEKEKQMGRTNGRRFGPRTIDMDILLFGDLVHNEKSLILPHPGLKERAFVLVPLLEICPGLTLPDGTRVKQFLERISFVMQGNKIFQT